MVSCALLLIWLRIFWTLEWRWISALEWAGWITYRKDDFHTEVESAWLRFGLVEPCISIRNFILPRLSRKKKKISFVGAVVNFFSARRCDSLTTAVLRICFSFFFFSSSFFFLSIENMQSHCKGKVNEGTSFGSRQRCLYRFPVDVLFNNRRLLN